MIKRFSRKAIRAIDSWLIQLDANPFLSVPLIVTIFGLDIIAGAIHYPPIRIASQLGFVVYLLADGRNRHTQDTTVDRVYWICVVAVTGYLIVNWMGKAGALQTNIQTAALIILILLSRIGKGGPPRKPRKVEDAPPDESTLGPEFVSFQS